MAFTYNPASDDIGRVRLIIGDKVEAEAMFSDEEIGAFLSMNEDSVKRGAAAALDSIASDQALVLKVVRTLDISTDGAAVARALREHAQRLRDEADASDAADGNLFDYAEMVNDEFTARERLLKQFARQT
jgi:Arc/MetJ family transcription regulator